MKTIVFVVAILLSATAVSGNNADERSAIVTTRVNERLTEEEISLIVNRVQEIRNMNFNDLSASQKSEIRKELREMKKMMQVGGGVYIGGTVLVIIIVLLLLLLV